VATPAGGEPTRREPLEKFTVVSGLTVSAERRSARIIPRESLLMTSFLEFGDVAVPAAAGTGAAISPFDAADAPVKGSGTRVGGEDRGDG
jgi:hypothetical protein